MGSGDADRGDVSAASSSSRHHHRDKDPDRGRDRGGSSSRHRRNRDTGHRDRASSSSRRRCDDRDGGRDRRHREKGREAREREKERERERGRERRRDAGGEEEEEEDGRERKRRRGSPHHDGDAGQGLALAPREETPERRGQAKGEGSAGSEQRRLEDEMERRRRRVREWQEERRGQQLRGEEEAAEAGRKWTLEGEESDGEGDKESGGGGGGGAMDMEEDEVDPLDAFMNSMVLPEVAKLESAAAAMAGVPDSSVDGKNDNITADVVSNGAKKGLKAMGRIMQGDDSDSDYDDDEDDEAGLEDEDDEEFMKRVKKTKVEKLAVVDHSKINYQPFRKNFYIEVKDITIMTSEEVAAYRKQFELKVHGKDVPKPIKTWVQSGQTSKILDTIKKLGFEKPMPIQAQALPIIMSGRDCIGVAKTGSGKTLAFVLPMLRHVKDQPPVVPGDGPIGLIVAPTRELVVQIHSDIKKFSKVLGISCVAVYGGSGVAQQISELKRGAEIVVCTPGRMIDILCTSNGKITNLKRVTFLVMDEADRMFDMGFEPQITRIVQNTRPDRQTVLFSATFPRQVEMLARKVLTKPIEIQVGGRSVVNKDITQLVEVRPESERFFRLLELLGEPFVKVLLIATSVAARGLDVKELELVVNYDVPNHYEDYVHRVGRTGRAGRKGSAVTFISEEEERYAPDLVKALELSEQAVPEDLKALADRFMAKVKQGTEQAHGTGYGGSGFKFNEQEDEARKSTMKAQAREYGYEEDTSGSDSDEEGVRKAGDDLDSQTQADPGANDDARARALQVIKKLHNDTRPEHYTVELEINDLPQHARWRITHRDTLAPIQEGGAAITIKGTYIPPGKFVGPKERKLYLFIEGATELSVMKAKAELKRVLEDCTKQALNLPRSAQTKKYSCH
ncbi:hypothetical protein ACP4OV_018263 [Aristida adscensionis]